MESGVFGESSSSCSGAVLLTSWNPSSCLMTVYISLLNTLSVMLLEPDLLHYLSRYYFDSDVQFNCCLRDEGTDYFFLERIDIKLVFKPTLD